MTNNIFINKKNFNDFKFLRKVALQVHNRRVAKEFNDIKDAKTIDTPRGHLKLACLIRPKDTVNDILLRIQLYHIVLAKGEGKTVASLPYFFETKHDPKLPQLAIVFKSAKANRKSGNYTLYIPWYNGNKNPNIPGYEKGQYQSTLHLIDATFVTINAVTETEGEKWLEAIKKYIRPAKLTGAYITTTKRKGKKLIVENMIPFYADYYPRGVNSEPIRLYLN